VVCLQVELEQSKDLLNSVQGAPVTIVTVVIPITMLTVVATLSQY